MVTTKILPKVTTKEVAIPFTKEKAISTMQLIRRCANAEQLNGTHDPSIKFIHYKGHQLLLKCTFATGDYDIKFWTSDDELRVTCNCKDAQPGVCVHVCKTVVAITEKYGDKYFAQLLPNRQFDLAFKYQFGFDKIESERGIGLTKRKEVMQLFPFDMPDFPLAINDILSIEAPPVQYNPEKREAVAFLLILPFAGKQPPFILPATGKMAKGNDRIVSWKHFLPLLDENAEKLVNVHQQELILKSSRQQERSEVFAIENNYRRFPKWNDKMMAAFDDWKEIYPLLQNEVFIYTYAYYGIRELKRRPSKTRANKVIVSMEKPEVFIKMTYAKERYQMTMGIKIGGREITSYNATNPFFLIHQGTLYMFDNYQDAAIAQWIDSAGIITTYKEHFAEFSESILKPLSEKYTLI